METAAQLIADVEHVFAQRDPALTEWEDPWRGRSPDDDAYSVCADPAKYRILGARVEAWAHALESRGVMEREIDATSNWAASTRQRPPISRIERWHPVADGALPFVVGRIVIGSDDDIGVVLGAGDPAVVVESIPDCGCDACDGGSAYDLAQIDEIVMAVIVGAFRFAQQGAFEERRLLTGRSTSGRPTSGARFRSTPLPPERIVEGAAWLELAGVDAWLSARSV